MRQDYRNDYGVGPIGLSDVGAFTQEQVSRLGQYPAAPSVLACWPCRVDLGSVRRNTLQRLRSPFACDRSDRQVVPTVLDLSQADMRLAKLPERSRYALAEAPASRMS